MKRVYFILTLFIASFFFVSLNKVRADSFDYTISDLNLINDDFYAVRDYALDYINQNKGYYIIYYSTSSSCYRLSLFPNLYNPSLTFNSSTITIKYASSLFTNDGVLYNYKNGEIQRYTSFKDSLIDLPISNNIITMYYLDSNIDLFNNSGNEVQINYNNKNYIVNADTPFPTLYQIYLNSKVDDEPVISDKFIEEKELMNNFYSTIFTKISDLATSLANNYIFLTIFGVFIFIFVLELIRRYLL